MKIKLGEALRYEQPTKYIVASEKYNDSYATPVLTAGKSFILGYTNEESGIYDNLPVIIFDDFTTDIKYVDFPFKVKSSAMKMLQPANENYNLKFFYYLIKYMNFQPTSHQRHWISKFAEMEFDIPERVKQDQIVEKLDKLVEMQSKKTTQLKKYDDLVKSQFIEMFGDLKNNSKNFELATIKDYFRVGSSKRVFEKDWTKSGVPFYRAREVVKLSENGFVDNELFISEKMYQEYSMKYGKPCADDIIVTAVGTLGKTYIVKPNDKFYYKDGNIILLHKINDISSIYVNYLYQTDFIKDQIIKTANVITVGTYTIKNAQNTQIIVPPIELQNQFADFVKHIDKLKFTLKEEIKKLQECYNSLMKEYFE